MVKKEDKLGKQLKARLNLLLDLNELPDNWERILQEYLRATIDGMPIYLEPDYQGYIRFQKVTLEQV
jgi:hypothetical protein